MTFMTFMTDGKSAVVKQTAAKQGRREPGNSLRTAQWVCERDGVGWHLTCGLFWTPTTLARADGEQTGNSKYPGAPPSGAQASRRASGVARWPPGAPTRRARTGPCVLPGRKKSTARLGPDIDWDSHPQCGAGRADPYTRGRHGIAHTQLLVHGPSPARPC